MSAITISRELGTDAPTIAHLVADMVGYEWLDKALIREVARVADVPEAEVERFDEVGERPFIRFLKDLLEPGGSASYGAWWASEFPGGMVASALPPIEEEGGEAPILDHERYKDLVRTVMARLADRGDVVIVGRGGQVLLKGRRDVLSVRLVAPLEFRKQVVVAREKIDAEAAADLIQEDGHRASALHPEPRGRGLGESRALSPHPQRAEHGDRRRGQDHRTRDVGAFGPRLTLREALPRQPHYLAGPWRTPPPNPLPASREGAKRVNRGCPSRSAGHPSRPPSFDLTVPRAPFRRISEGLFDFTPGAAYLPAGHRL